MSLLLDFEKSCLKARKEKAENAISLSSTLSEIKMIGKNNGNRDTNDSEVIKFLNKLIKRNIGVLELIEKDETRKEAAKKLKEENAFYSTYIPKQLSSEDLAKEVEKLILELDAKSMKDMGRVMSAINKSFDGQFDGKACSDIVKKNLIRK